MNILFVDSVGYKYYTANTLRTEALGGTEATVLRVARGLAARGHSVGHLNLPHFQDKEQVADGVMHLGDDSADIKPDIVIHLRTAVMVEEVKEEWPKAKHIVWLHDLGSDRLLKENYDDVDTVVGVSEWHLNKTLLPFIDGCADMRFIYNPVEAQPQQVERVKGRLGFFSSPHKGLAEVIAKARAVNCKELVVANPGYFKHEGGLPGWVTVLGELPHHKALEEMAKCEALFYPQTVFPETFGLVLAEANAVGTPVLAHDFGAAKEVLCGVPDNAVANRVCDGSLPEAVAANLESLLNRNVGHPVLDPRFCLDTVLDQWEALLA